MTMSGGNDLEFQHWLAVLRRRRLAFFGVFITVLLAAAAAGTLRERQYTAAAMVLVGQPNPLNGAAPTTPPNLPAALAFATGSEVTQRARAKLADAPRAEVTSDEAGGSLSFTVTAASADLAAEAANTYADAFLTERRAGLNRQYVATVTQLRDALVAVGRELAAAKPTDLDRIQLLVGQRNAYKEQLNATWLSFAVGWVAADQLLVPATRPGRPSGPSPLGLLGYALVIGVLLSVGVVALAEFSDRTVRTSAAARVATGGLPVLGRIDEAPVRLWGPSRGHRGRRRRRRRRPFGKGPRPDRLVAPMATEAASPVSESFRCLAATVGTLRSGTVRRVQVTSARADDGAQEVAVNLAVALAALGNRTVLVCPGNPAALGLALVRTSGPDASLRSVRAAGLAAAGVRAPGGQAVAHDGRGETHLPATDPGRPAEIDGAASVDGAETSADASVGGAGPSADASGVAQGEDQPPVVLYSVIGVDELRVVSMAGLPVRRSGAGSARSQAGWLELLERIGGAGSRLVVLSGPALTSATALEWAGIVDGTILCLREGETRIPDLGAVSERLAVMGVPALGIVFG
jgi:hypothetical protein